MIRESRGSKLRRLYRYPKRDRTVIDERDPHVGTKAAGRNGLAAALNLCREPLKQSAGALRRRRATETRPVPAPGVGRKCELWDQQNLAADRTDSEIHPVLFVVEKPEFEQSIGHSHDLWLGIVMLDGN